eukprot:6200912-Pleurochrysis_carterae.AAC.3
MQCRLALRVPPRRNLVSCNRVRPLTAATPICAQTLRPAVISCHNDHRIAMSFAVRIRAALHADACWPVVTYAGVGGPSEHQHVLKA